MDRAISSIGTAPSNRRRRRPASGRGLRNHHRWSRRHFYCSNTSRGNPGRKGRRQRDYSSGISRRQGSSSRRQRDCRRRARSRRRRTWCSAWSGARAKLDTLRVVGVEIGAGPSRLARLVARVRLAAALAVRWDGAEDGGGRGEGEDGEVEGVASAMHVGRLSDYL